jgi:hypothetical protein
MTDYDDDCGGPCSVCGNEDSEDYGPGIDPREDRDYDLAREDGWSYEDIRDRAYRLTEED